MKRMLLFSWIVIVLISCGQSTGNSHGKSTSGDDGTRRQVLITSEFGEIKIELYDETPLHRDNFIKLVEEGLYDQTLFHRVINGFMIQGGDPDSKNAAPGQQLGMGGPGYTVPAEFVSTFIHEKGSLAAARQGDQVNPMKESSGSQFYIVHGRVFSPEELDMFEQRSGKVFTNEQRKAYTTVGGAPHLDGEYTVFGRVVEGLEAIDKIAAVEVDRANRPLDDVRVSMKVLN
jgi:cyclophilin family peptidyl-prolyl cis-trans isomerase